MDLAVQAIAQSVPSVLTQVVEADGLGIRKLRFLESASGSDPSEAALSITLDALLQANHSVWVRMEFAETSETQGQPIMIATAVLGKVEGFHDFCGLPSLQYIDATIIVCKKTI